MDVISFARGNPSPDILPVEALGECAQAVIARDGRTILNYGPAGGYPPLREWIAAQHGVEQSQVVISTGSLTGFNFLMRHLFADGGRAVIEAPSYDRTIVVLRSVRAEISSVPLTDAGLDLDRLESVVSDGPAPKVVYTIPTFQNPSGRTIPLEQRQALVELAQAKGFLIYEDDPYRLVRYSGEPLPSMYDLAEGRNVVFSSSFSKTGAPGLRVGYMIVPPELDEADRGDRRVDVHRPAPAAAGDAPRVHPARPVRAESRGGLYRAASAAGHDARRAQG